MKQIGIKLADGSFYPIMEEGSAESKVLELTTVQDNQTTVQIDLYRSETGSMDDAEYVDTLEIKNLNPHPNGEPNFKLNIALDENDNLTAKVKDPETGTKSETELNLITLPVSERGKPVNFSIDEVPDKDNSTAFNILSDDSGFDNTIANDFEDNMLTSEENSADTEVEENIVIGPSPNDETFAFDALDNSETTRKDELDLPEEIDIPSEDLTHDPAIDSIINDYSEEPEQDTLDENPLADGDFDLGDFIESSEEPAAEEPADEEEAIADEEVPAESTSDELALPDIEEDIAEEPSDFSSEDLSLPDTDIPTFSELTADEEPVVEEEAAEEDTSDELVLPDFGEEAVTEEPAVEEEVIADDEEASDLPDFSDLAVDSEPAVENTADELVLPDLGEEIVSEEPVPDEEPAVENTADELVLPDLGEEIVSEEPVPDEEPAVENTADEFNLPDFGDDTVTEDSIIEESDSLDLPDFGDEPVTEDESFINEESSREERDTTFDLPDFDDDTTSAQPVGINGLFDEDFGEVDLSDQLTDDDDLKSKDPTFVPSNNMFNDLYDKETLEGNSSFYEEEEAQKKTHTHVIICLVCAIICILAVVSLLFIIPSKINVVKKAKADKTPVEVVEETEEPVTEPVVEEEIIADEEPEADLSNVELVFNEEEPEAEPVEEEIPEPVDTSAKEDEIVVADTDLPIVPETPAEPAEKPEDIRYKIIWGDTLWDISEAYYKNPWRYTSIARYNGIKNPDHIVAGTWILIPAQ